MKSKYFILSLLGLLTSSIVVLVLGYSLGYNQSFRLQNANAFSALVSITETLQKIESLVNEEEIERAKRLIRITVESHRSRFDEFKSLQREARGIVIPSLSGGLLVDQIMEPTIKREQDLLMKMAKQKVPTPSE